MICKYTKFHVLTLKSRKKSHEWQVMTSFTDLLIHCAQLVEALCYKSEGRGFDSPWCHWNFSLT